jgi:hypothetical protein
MATLLGIHVSSAEHYDGLVFSFCAGRHGLEIRHSESLFQRRFIYFFVSLGYIRLSLDCCGHFLPNHFQFVVHSWAIYCAKPRIQEHDLNLATVKKENKLIFGSVDRCWIMDNKKRNFNL